MVSLARASLHYEIERFMMRTMTPLLRFPAIAALLVLAACGNGGGAGPAPTVDEQIVPPLDTPIAITCTRNAISPPRHFIGINIGGEALNVRSALHDLGLTWVRTDVHWDLIEQKEGIYDWKQLDAGVLLAAKERLTLSLIIGHAPEWANGFSDTDFAKASARFVRALVLRYKPGGILATAEKLSDYGVAYFEVFNEPNLPGYGWGNHGDNPKKLLARYTKTLPRISEAIRAADNSAYIILAGLSSDGMPVTDFLNVLYASGVSACFDIVAFHPYGYEGKFAEAYKLIRDVLASHGDSSMPIWFNEYGTNDELRQEAVLRDALAQRTIPDALFWFALVDYDQIDGRYGLLRADGKEKSVYATFKALLRDK